MSAKWGMFGKSFYDIGQAIIGRTKDINSALTETNNFSASLKKSPSIMQRLFPGKKSIKSQLIDVDKLYSGIDDTKATKILSDLQKNQKLIDKTKGSWQKYFSTLKKGEEWQINFVKNTDLQKASLSDVKDAYESARQSAIDHNTALQQQTLGFKAATAAANVLKTAFNAIAYMAITQAIVAVANTIITKFDEVVNAYQNGIDKLKDLSSEIKSLESEQSSLNSELKESKERLYELQQLEMPTLFEK
ncbi:MAG: hypothetical protein HDT46_10590, partial [Ruminococcaceae bacterium]|nr:hypothetical protein [Oscillospiraceae bacterium]